MPDTLQFFHICNHEFRQSEEGDVKTFTVYHDQQSDVSIIDGGIRVLEILEVRALDFNSPPNDEDFRYDDYYSGQYYDDEDRADGIYDDRSSYVVDYSSYFQEGREKSKVLPQHFYKAFLHNRIKWNVMPPLKYEVKARIIYTTSSFRRLPMEECPRCQGKGWFVDIFNQQQKVLKVNGPLRIVQRFLKDLLTNVGSSPLNVDYGTSFYQQLSKGETDEKIFTDVRMIISEVEDEYLSYQETIEEDLEADEILQKVNVMNVYRSSNKETSVVVELEFITLKNAQSFRVAI